MGGPRKSFRFAPGHEQENENDCIWKGMQDHFLFFEDGWYLRSLSLRQKNEAREDGVFGQRMEGLGGENCPHTLIYLRGIEEIGDDITDLQFGGDGYYFVRHA